MDLRGRAIGHGLTARPVIVRLLAGVITALVVVWISRGELDPLRATVPAVVLAGTVLAWSIHAAGTQLPAGSVPLLVLAAAAATYGCVPETDPLLQLAPVAGLSMLVEVAARRPLGFPAWWAAAGLVFWAGVHGSSGRASALVGALTAWWPLVLLAVIGQLRLLPGDRRLRLALAMPAVTATLIVARTGALERTVEPALRAAAVWCGASLAATAAVAIGLRATARARPVSGPDGRRGARRRSNRP